jgi:hypothetical protein
MGGLTKDGLSFDEQKVIDSIPAWELKKREELKKYNPITKPKHYNSYPDIEVIQLTEHMNFCRGNVVKYIARAEFKRSELEDLKKAMWYLSREINRLEKK